MPKRNPSRRFRHCPYSLTGFVSSGIASDSEHYVETMPHSVQCVVANPSDSSSISSVDTLWKFCDPYVPIQAPTKTPNRIVSVEEAFGAIGKYFDAACTAAGSSFVQAVLLRYGENTLGRAAVAELSPHFPDLILHNHGCYAARALLEIMTSEERLALLNPLMASVELWMKVACKNLHTRRLFYCLLDLLIPEGNADFLFKLLLPPLVGQLIQTKDGCVTAQRMLERCSSGLREICFSHIRKYLAHYSTHEHANYVVQLMIEFSSPLNVACLREALLVDAPLLLCHHLGSNIFENIFQKAPSHQQMKIVEILFCKVGPASFCTIANSEYGNYVILKTITLAPLASIHHTILPTLEAMMPLLNCGTEFVMQALSMSKPN